MFAVVPVSRSRDRRPRSGRRLSDVHRGRAGHPPDIPSEATAQSELSGLAVAAGRSMAGWSRRGDDRARASPTT